MAVWERSSPALLGELEALAGADALSVEQLEALAERYRVPRSVVQGLRTFYFPETPAAEGEVCAGLPCYLRRSAAGLREPAAGWPRVACLGYCAQAPALRRGSRYFRQVAEGVEEIPESTAEHVARCRESLEAYRAHGGYATLGRYLAEPDPQALLVAVERAALRGMGGAGFPAHVKWKAVRASQDPERVLLVNAHEGEPATFKDREILELEPHRLLEGAYLAALAVGARRIVVGLRSEYENARRSLDAALAELAAADPPSRAGPPLPTVEVRVVPGPYVTGEETALLEALEGKRSEPRLRPPFPAEAGLEGRPTLVQNVETLATLPALLGTAAGAYVPEKVYCLTGDVERPGAYRRPLGTPASQLIEQDGGTSASSLKAFLPGGLSGGLLPADRLGVPLDFDAVRREGAGLGTGAVVAIGRDRCLVDVLEQIAVFFAGESCGKCVPCRLGTAKLARLLASLRAGEATEADVEQGLELARVLQETSICALGQVAGKAFVDAMRYFPQELLAHTRGECPARRGPEAASR